MQNAQSVCRHRWEGRTSAVMTQYWWYSSSNPPQRVQYQLRALPLQATSPTTNHSSRLWRGCFKKRSLLHRPTRPWWMTIHPHPHHHRCRHLRVTAYWRSCPSCDRATDQCASTTHQPPVLATTPRMVSPVPAAVAVAVVRVAVVLAY